MDIKGLLRSVGEEGFVKQVVRFLDIIHKGTAFFSGLICQQDVVSLIWLKFIQPVVSSLAMMEFWW